MSKKSNFHETFIISQYIVHVISFLEKINSQNFNVFLINY